jgi:hypothetical protein
VREREESREKMDGWKQKKWSDKVTGKEFDI